MENGIILLKSIYGSGFDCFVRSQLISVISDSHQITYLRLAFKLTEK